MMPAIRNGSRRMPLILEEHANIHSSTLFGAEVVTKSILSLRCARSSPSTLPAWIYRVDIMPFDRAHDAISPWVQAQSIYEPHPPTGGMPLLPWRRPIRPIGLPPPPLPPPPPPPLPQPPPPPPAHTHTRAHTHTHSHT
mmetsp:Transcript_36185/g.59930  ORF Transcript_36185/g.59930 Transcript_36185/m.59930 type:complete len:139 (+) Transcript_36185:140-556(+)